MEVLKTVLRRSIRKKAWQVSLSVGQPAYIENDRGTDEIELDQPIDEAALGEVFRFLFPKDFDKLETKKPVQGALKVPNIGTINVVAQYPHTLHLFIPPDGNEKFNLFWDEVNAVSSPDLTASNVLPAETPKAHEVPRAPTAAPSHEPLVAATPPAPSGSTEDHVIDVSQSFASGLGANTKTNFKPLPTESKVEVSQPTIVPTDKELPEPGSGFVPALAPKHGKSSYSVAEAQGVADVIQSEVDVHDFDPNFSIGIKGIKTNPEPVPTPAEPKAESPAESNAVAIPMPTPEPEMSVDDEDDGGMSFVPPEPDLADLSQDPMPFPERGDIGSITSHSRPSGDTLAALPGMPDDEETPTSAAQVDFNIPSHPVDDGERSGHFQNNMGRVTKEQNISSLKINFGVDNAKEGHTSEGINSIDVLLKQMVQKGASDLHLTTGLPVTLRIDGDIVRVDSAPVSEKNMESYLLPITPGYNLEEIARANDTDFAYEIRNVGRFRVNIFRDRMGISAVLRHIPSEIKPASELGLPQAVCELTKLNKGLVLVTGPTGSGKSTTLAAMVHEINRSRAQHIITIEDPIEYIHPQLKCLVHQREVHRHTESFGRALRAALREDPDVILIGELRDLETIATAIETAETGHLVLGTLHTNSATSTVDRMIDMFPAEQQEQVRQMLSSSLKGVITQNLIKRKGGGRVPAFEVLMVNDAAAAMIREGKTHMLTNHMQTQKAVGNVLMNDSMLHLVKADVVNPIEAYSKAADKKAFADQLRRAGFHIKFEGGSNAPPATAAGAATAAPKRNQNYRAG